MYILRTILANKAVFALLGYNAGVNNQVFNTVISGTLVFVLGQTIQQFILEPVQKYRKTVGKIDNRLKFYSNIITSNIFENDKTMLNEITDSIRNLSCDLESSYKQIPLTKLLASLGVIESEKDVAKAAQALIFLSNAGGRGENKGIGMCETQIGNVRRLLNIKHLQTER
jgi:hypothetical protein